MLSPTHQELLTSEGMARARDAIINRHSWFLHVSDHQRHDSLKQSGILPKNPGERLGLYVPPPAGTPSGSIVCLRPIFTFDTTPQRDHDQIILAISNSDLPARVGIDWSYDGCWGLVDVLKEQGPGAHSSAIFAEVVRKTGCVASYDPVPLSAVRAWTVGTPRIDPAKWPLLSQCAITDLAVLRYS